MGNMKDIVATFLDVVLGVFYIWLFSRGWRVILGTLEPRRSSTRPAAPPASIGAQLDSLAKVCDDHAVPAASAKTAVAAR